MSEGHTQRLEAALAGRYKIERKLGEGGMASVYLAEDLKHKRNVALKILWNETSPALSPDGHWLAYQSRETDPPEIFVRSFPDASGRWQVSEGGGYEPLWSPEGTGIWYRAWSGGDVMLADVTTEPTFAVGARRQVLEAAAFNGFSWDVHPDGRRFLALRSGDQDTVDQMRRGRFRVVINWFDELRAQGLLGGND